MHGLCMVSTWLVLDSQPVCPAWLCKRTKNILFILTPHHTQQCGDMESRHQANMERCHNHNKDLHQIQDSRIKCHVGLQETWQGHVKYS